jgi:glucose uptake protein GlcU
VEVTPLLKISTLVLGVINLMGLIIPGVIISSFNEEKNNIKSYQFGLNSYTNKSVDFEIFSDIVINLRYYGFLLNIMLPALSYQCLEFIR